MEPNLSSQLSEKYFGNLVYNESKEIINTTISVVRLNNILIKILFDLNGRRYTFRAMLSDQEEGVLMIIQERVEIRHILTGVSGFLRNKPNIHGGLISRLGSFYFHVEIQNFDGTQEEIYFLGKRPEEHEMMMQERSKCLLSVNIR